MTINFLIASVVCVLGTAEICYPGVGTLSSPGSLRGSRTISSPGSSGTLSGGGGIGNLYSSPQGAGVLSTSMNRAPNYNALRTNRSSHNSNAMRSNISRSSAPARTTTGNRRHTPGQTSGISAIPRTTPGRKSSTKHQPNMPSNMPGFQPASGVLKSRTAKTAQPALRGNFSAASYASAVGGEVIQQKTQPDKPIITLVPERPGIYQQKMQEAETAFRNREFRAAISAYNLSGDLSDNSPESLLGLMFCYFAADDDVYDLAALYLERTLECFPELPLVNIDLQAFYLDPIQYRRDLAQLKKYTKANPKQSQAQFMLGYFLWREGEFENSRKALMAALEYSQNEKLHEAIDTLWSGMVASGEVSGTLKNDKAESQEGKDAEKSEKTSKTSGSPEVDKSE